MSTKTTNLGMILNDGQDKFSVSDINNNFEKIDTAIGNISDVYNEETTYSAGNYCIYNNEMYKCLEETTGAFDTTKWKSTRIGNAISELNSNQGYLPWIKESATIGGKLSINRITHIGWDYEKSCLKVMVDNSTWVYFKPV